MTVVMIVSEFSCLPSQWGHKKCIRVALAKLELSSCVKLFKVLRTRTDNGETIFILQ